VPFHPCGKVMDYLRAGYFSDMVLWQDGEPIPGRWFRAPEDADILEEFSPFRARRVYDHPEDEPTPLGESATQEWRYSGAGNTIGYDGQHYCGSVHAFSEGGVAGVDDPIVTLPNGSAECCLVPVPVVFGGCGGRFPDPQGFWNASAINEVGKVGYLVLVSRAISAVPTLYTPVGWSLVDEKQESLGVQFTRVALYTRIWTGTAADSGNVSVTPLQTVLSYLLSLDPDNTVVEDFQSALLISSAPFIAPDVTSGGPDRLRVTIMYWGAVPTINPPLPDNPICWQDFAAEGFLRAWWDEVQVSGVIPGHVIATGSAGAFGQAVTILFAAL